MSELPCSPVPDFIWELIRIICDAQSVMFCSQPGVASLSQHHHQKQSIPLHHLSPPPSATSAHTTSMHPSNGGQVGEQVEFLWRLVHEASLVCASSAWNEQKRGGMGRLQAVTFVSAGKGQAVFKSHPPPTSFCSSLGGRRRLLLLWSSSNLLPASWQRIRLPRRVAGRRGQRTEGLGAHLCVASLRLLLYMNTSCGLIAGPPQP